LEETKKLLHNLIDQFAPSLTATKSEVYCANWNRIMAELSLVRITIKLQFCSRMIEESRRKEHLRRLEDALKVHMYLYVAINKHSQGAKRLCERNWKMVFS
jgi:hypothetical protein